MYALDSGKRSEDNEDTDTRTLNNNHNEYSRKDCVVGPAAVSLPGIENIDDNSNCYLRPEESCNRWIVTMVLENTPPQPQDDGFV